MVQGVKMIFDKLFKKKETPKRYCKNCGKEILNNWYGNDLPITANQYCSQFCQYEHFDKVMDYGFGNRDDE